MNFQKQYDKPCKAWEDVPPAGTALGAFCDPDRTEFRLWAPTASRVQLRLYRDGSLGKPFCTLPLERGRWGLWTQVCQGDLDGVYYDYRVTVDGVSRGTGDPYARACGKNGLRSMAVNLPRTNPPGWAEDAPPPQPAEDILYELHVKDFSWAESGGFPPEVRGKYLAFTRTGTTLRGEGRFPTGIDYLKRLDVTHVQLMPVFDFDQVDEGGDPAEYNWGYNPVSYNAPEGSYATDPNRGAVRIRELKELVQALHRNGLRVVMDVVYNHTSHRDSWLERTAPGYYYRTNPDGSWSDGSACGNDIASEREMCRRYIVNSVLYWAEEYHMDGFRFDLMGLLDTETMEAVRAALDARWGKGEKLVYGEPWGAGASNMAEGSLPADAAHLSGMDRNIGAFCDATRDTVKGSALAPDSVGFVNGGTGLGPAALRCAAGWCGPGQRFSAAAPSQVITYLSAHDNQTLWDKLVYTLDPERRYDRMTPELLQVNRLAAAMLFTCQGRLFLLAGEEFARTKQGMDNSYNASPDLNQIDWERAWQNRALVDYYRGLIALRKQLPGLCDKSADAKGRIRDGRICTDRCVSFRVDNRPDDRWQELLIVWNAGDSPAALDVEPDGWQVLADGADSFLWQKGRTLQRPEVGPVSALLLGRPDARR
ncbi:MAG: type I pullulanase [Clostridiales bacterium]|nr:type I pullulanase [Clostridiales bacterium]